MSVKNLYFVSLIILSMTILNCSNAETAVLFSDSMNSNTQLRQSDNMHFTSDISSDSDGSYMLPADSSAVFPLLAVHNIDVENTVIVYSAYVKTIDVKGRCYLEMWCFFPGRGRFFSRGLDNTLTGNNDWTEVTTPFFLKEGENPDSIHLNLIIEGSGTVYIDNIRLLQTYN